MEKLPYPKGEIRWKGIHYKTGELRYLITSKPDRVRYNLYELKDGQFIRLGSGPSPKKLEEKFVDWDSLRNQDLNNEAETEDDLEI